MFLLLPGFLLFGSYGVVARNGRHRSVVKEDVTLDLFVQEAFLKYRDNGAIFDNTTQECNTCSDSVSDNGCTVGLRFFVEGDCQFLEFGLYARIVGLTNTATGTDIEGGSSDSVLCVQTYEDDACTIPTVDDENISCSEIWPLDKCSVAPTRGLNGLNRVVRRLQDWCIRSNAPMEDYTVPLVRQYTYADVGIREEPVTDQQVKEACEEKNSSFLAFYSSFPGSGRECFYEPVDVAQTDGNGSAPAVVLGSAQNYCDEETGTHTIRLFTNTNCSVSEMEGGEQNIQPLFPTFNLTSYPECGNPFEFYGFTNLRSYRTSNCQTPEYYCKPVTGTASEFITDLSPSEETRGSSQPSSNPTHFPTSMPNGSGASTGPEVSSSIDHKYFAVSLLVPLMVCMGFVSALEMTLA